MQKYQQRCPLLSDDGLVLIALLQVLCVYDRFVVVCFHDNATRSEGVRGRSVLFHQKRAVASHDHVEFLHAYVRGLVSGAT